MTFNRQRGNIFRYSTPRRVIAVLLSVAGGCSQYIDPNVPEPIRPFVAPESGSEYLLYRPSSYDRNQSWPLVVVCHSSFPDSPNRQIREWTQHSEENGFIVVAPKLVGSSATLPPATQKQISLQQQDEQRILAAIRYVRAGHTISEDRIFIHGWSGGARAAVHTGLQHPTLFRAVSLLAPKFDSDHHRALRNRIDPYQPIYLRYDVGDAITGKNGSRCAKWLRTNGAKLREENGGTASKSSTETAVEFLRNVIRTEPWIHLRAIRTADRGPMAMQFKLRCSYVPAHIHWEFGDGDTSDVAEPIHLFRNPGTYRVQVRIADSTRVQHRRIAYLTLPSGRLHASPPTNDRD